MRRSTNAAGAFVVMGVKQKRSIFIGDHKQLRPTVLSYAAQAAGLWTSVSRGQHKRPSSTSEVFCFFRPTLQFPSAFRFDVEILFDDETILETSPGSSEGLKLITKILILDKIANFITK